MPDVMLVNEQPDRLRSLWKELKAMLHAAKQDWQVWANWYDDRLAGRVRNEKRELAYVRIEDALWNQGPAIVNAEIKRRIEEPTPPAPIQNVPSAVSFGWTSRGTITVVPGAQNWPVFPFQGGERDHANRLEACRVLATETARSLRGGNWNARSDYAETLDQYAAHLPKQPGEGNFLLADAEARVVRSMFAAEQDFLPVPLAAKLKVLLDSKSVFAPIIPRRKISTIRCDRGIWNVRCQSTPPTDLSKASATIRLSSSSPMLPAHWKLPPGQSPRPRRLNWKQPTPPPDPLGEVDPEKSRRFTLATGINALCGVLREKGGRKP